MVVPRKFARENRMGERFAQEADQNLARRRRAPSTKPYTIPPLIIEEFNRHQSIVDAAQKMRIHPDEFLFPGMHLPSIMNGAASQWLGSQHKIVQEEWKRVPSANFLAMRLGVKFWDLLGKRRLLVPKVLRPAFLESAKRELQAGHPVELSAEERAKLLAEVEKNMPHWMQ